MNFCGVNVPADEGVQCQAYVPGGTASEVGGLLLVLAACSTLMLVAWLYGKWVDARAARRKRERLERERPAREAEAAARAQWWAADGSRWWDQAGPERWYWDEQERRRREWEAAGRPPKWDKPWEAGLSFPKLAGIDPEDRHRY